MWAVCCFRKWHVIIIFYLQRWVYVIYVNQAMKRGHWKDWHSYFPLNFIDILFVISIVRIKSSDICIFWWLLSSSLFCRIKYHVIVCLKVFQFTNAPLDSGRKKNEPIRNYFNSDERVFLLKKILQWQLAKLKIGHSSIFNIRV